MQNGGEEWFLPTTSINTWVGDAQDLTLNAECSMLLTPMVDAELTPYAKTVHSSSSSVTHRNSVVSTHPSFIPFCFFSNAHPILVRVPAPCCRRCCLSYEEKWIDRQEAGQQDSTISRRAGRETRNTLSGEEANTQFNSKCRSFQ